MVPETSRVWTVVVTGAGLRDTSLREEPCRADGRRGARAEWLALRGKTWCGTASHVDIGGSPMHASVHATLGHSGVAPVRGVGVQVPLRTPNCGTYATLVYRYLDTFPATAVPISPSLCRAAFPLARWSK